ncbi:MAG: PilN domain-containing protein [Tissierellales bacterium]|nr:PilN domain-containing protein [Tissierellales bacterium]
MRDLNFFEPYIEKKQTRITFTNILYALIIISLVVVVTLGVYNQTKISNLNKEIKFREDIVNDPQTVAKVEEIKKFDDEVKQFKVEVDKIISLDKSIVENEIISTDLFKEISKRLPDDVFISNIQASNNSINISGFSMDRYSIAEFQKGLETIDIIDSTFVPSINKVDSYYTFSVNIGIREVQEDGEETEEQ